MTQKRIKTSKKEIAEYWKDRIDNHETSVSFKHATSHCWRCGVKKRLDRAHIVPASKNGLDSPENFVLLCKHCHIDNPNLDNVEIVWDWLRAYKLSEDESLWYVQGLREYQYVYGESLEVSLTNLGIERDLFNQEFEVTLSGVGHHFGQPRHNRATIAGAIKMTLDRMKGNTL